MNNIVTGLAAVMDGLSLVRQRGLRRFVAIPILINLVVFITLGWWLVGQFESWLESLSWLERWADVWLVGGIITVMQWLFGIVLLVIAFYTFTVIANLIGAPFNALLAEKVEAHLRAGATASQPVDWWALVRSVPGSIINEASKLLYMIKWLIPLGILYLIPGLQILAAPLTLLFGAWMLAVEYMDYPMGNHGMNFRSVRAQLKSRRASSLGFGAGVTLLTLVPVLNLVAMPVAVAAATSLWVKQNQQSPDRNE